MKIEEICQNCRWYVESGSTKHGYCKRFPPVFTKNDDQGRPRFYNPVISPNSFCGEWEEVEE